MLTLAALAAAAAVGAPPPIYPGGTATSVFPKGDVQIEAGTVVYEQDKGLYRVEDGAILRRGTVVLRARTAEMNPDTGEVHAAGDVLLTDAMRVIRADAVSAILDGPFEAENVTAFLKERPVDLSGVSDLGVARKLGRNSLSVWGKKVWGSPDEHLRVLGARLTLCDCGEKEPSWSIRAPDAHVIPGKSATMSWPVLYVKPPFVDRSVPVLILPWLYVPLGERQSGVLFPVIESTPATGFAPGLPIYITLGESADMTFTPGYAFGPSGAPSTGAVAGPLARLEFRWTPEVHAEGVAELLWVNDHIAEPGGASGSRWSLELKHLSGTEADLAWRADLALASDGVLWRDLTTDYLLRSAPYRRSSVLDAHLLGPALLESGVSYLQPLEPNGTIGGYPKYGFVGSDVGLAQLAPWASLTLPVTEMGPLYVDGRVGMNRFASLSGGSDLAGRPDAGRVNARFNLEAPLVVQNFLSISPYLRAATLDYLGANAGEPVAWGTAGAVVSSEVSRSYGSFKHAIGVQAEARIGSATVGREPRFPAYDEYDRVGLNFTGGETRSLSAGPPGAFEQGRFALETRLARGGATLARISAGEDLDLAAGRFEDTFVEGKLSIDHLYAVLEARLRDPSARYASTLGFERAPLPIVAPSVLDRLSELRFSFVGGDPKATNLHGSIVAVSQEAPGTLLAGLDELFDERGVGVGPISQVSSGAKVALGSSLLGYDVLFPGRAGVAAVTCGVTTKYLSAFAVQQQTGTFVWNSTCHCFALTVKVSVDACGGLSYGFSLDLTHLADHGQPQ